MPNVIIDDTHLHSIANAIREQTRESTTYKPSEMADAVTYSAMKTRLEVGRKTIAWTELPEELIYFGSYAFIYCTRLALTHLPENTEGCEGYAFYECKNLALASLPTKKLRFLQNGCFYGCENMTVSNIPPLLTTIAKQVFMGCKKLSVSEIPSGVQTIASQAFCGCVGLTSITFKGTPTSIDATAFEGCTNLRNFYVPWSEGEVANAPWGATNATIHYNHVSEVTT